MSENQYTPKVAISQFVFNNDGKVKSYDFGIVNTDIFNKHPEWNAIRMITSNEEYVDFLATMKKPVDGLSNKIIESYISLGDSRSSGFTVTDEIVLGGFGVIVTKEMIDSAIEKYGKIAIEDQSWNLKKIIDPNDEHWLVSGYSYHKTQGYVLGDYYIYKDIKKVKYKLKKLKENKVCLTAGLIATVAIAVRNKVLNNIDPYISHRFQRNENLIGSLKELKKYLDIELALLKMKITDDINYDFEIVCHLSLLWRFDFMPENIKNRKQTDVNCRKEEDALVPIVKEKICKVINLIIKRSGFKSWCKKNCGTYINFHKKFRKKRIKNGRI